jgi:proton-translocating NADH-quinone oxidoreductase chain L
MYLLIVVLPFLGFLFAGGFGRFLGFRGSAMLSTACVSLSAFLSCIAFYEVALSGSPCYIKLAPWIYSELFDASWGFLFDSLTVVMLVVVTFVSSLVHLYSISYMSEDPHLPRFMSYLSIFTFFMLMLVTGDNFLQMFFGWEGVGLASYLLINFWFTRLQANKSAIKAMLVNRVGDFGLALGIMGIFSIFKTVDFTTVFACANQFAGHADFVSVLHLPQSGSLEDNTVPHFLFCNIEFDILNTLCLLLFVGAVGKSAQLGLHTWLPDAMEGPTPVSALIHAATMVTAGVFMIARCSPLFEYAPTALVVITFIGAMTSFFAATTGVVQNDLKRVIAYSTCSQLGYMIFACGISNYSVGVFHLMNHAFFKALLFLSAGSVIHALSDEQDMRKMGGVAQILPFTYAMMVIGSLALIGFPFLTGFYSKDVILEVAYAKYTLSGNFAYWLGSLSALFTSYYSFRLLFLTFLAPAGSSDEVDTKRVKSDQFTNSFKQSIAHAHDAPIIMAIPLILLAFGSIFVGYLGKDMMIGLGTNFWGNALYTLPQNSILLESEYIPQSIKFVPLFFSLFGALIAYQVNLSANGLRTTYSVKTSILGKNLYTFLNKRWLFDKVYNDFFVQKALSFGYEVSFKTLDKGMIEILGPYGISQTFQKLSRQMSKMQSGFVYHYALSMLIGLTLCIAIVGLWDFISFWIDNRLYFIQFISFIFYNIYCQGEENA